MPEHAPTGNTSSVCATLSQSTFKALWQRLVKEAEVVSAGPSVDCWRHPNRPNVKGYIQIAVTNRIKIYTHHIAARQRYGLAALPQSRRQHVSHLCHHPWCCNPDHLCIEDEGYNRSRSFCPFEVVCPNCVTRVMVCNHMPRCLLPPANRS